MSKIITSESVTEGHPDKVCDLIADSILDYILEQDPDAKVAIEVSLKEDVCFIFGEVQTSIQDEIPYEDIAQDVIFEVGYVDELETYVHVCKQSPEINTAVTKGGEEDLAAGDQGIMFGYASNETPNLMPAPIYYAHKITEALSELRKNGYGGILGPDGKSQVSFCYRDNEPICIDTIVVSTQHTPGVTIEELEELIIDKVIKRVIPSKYLTPATHILINPSGSFVTGGAWADAGTTGRKLVCDSYGGSAHIGGGAYSGKDISKVDRSVAYYCRYVAKSIVAAGLADKFEVHVSYAIGKPEPIGIFVNSFNTGKYSDFALLHIVKKNFDFRVANIIEELNLKRPIYRETTNYGHFGKNHLPWEKPKTIDIEDIF